MFNLKSYASYFASYLLANIKNEERIEKITLFGSVAKKESTKDSDIDIFLEVGKASKDLEKEIDAILEDFYNSREALIFKSKKIENKINLIIGRLNDWKDLKESIDSTGIVLYGRYVPKGATGNKFALISWDNIGLNRGAFLNKLYGFKVSGKKYLGLIEKLQGKKLGKSTIMIPIENQEQILSLIKYHKVRANILEIWS